MIMPAMMMLMMLPKFPPTIEIMPITMLMTDNITVTVHAQPGTVNLSAGQHVSFSSYLLAAFYKHICHTFAALSQLLHRMSNQCFGEFLKPRALTA